ncbi:protein phosphatase regulator PIG1 NDAI_0I02460 [Naumovozyma dairenensis CBS 421]|uniref:CBM21 domain-containing protein n=1 Tax=Naumovozyma dairenensis (strain ATCC 10597 / BCRC 20456 / CBS 421 / NBRC 0211 / NRRL Y-12639) TaxID=1071378 RepID=G0WGA3_NAUDC|nr:hypothetical protein NDAI_0I02460 [Naumovozyma dairenensis CBS 421]CCD26814.1 hypothetical protein NDAI_0I02460 [Naumovozyma dairenensis CBS 421]
MIYQEPNRKQPLMNNKSALKKIIKTHSNSSISSATTTTTSSSSSSLKNVRFAPELTTVKNFCSNDEPISISNETSPSLLPIEHSHFKNYDDRNGDDDDDDDILLPLENYRLSNNFNYNFNFNLHTRNNNNSELESDSDLELDSDFDLKYFDNLNFNNFLLDTNKNKKKPYCHNNNNNNDIHRLIPMDEIPSIKPLLSVDTTTTSPSSSNDTTTEEDELLLNIHQKYDFNIIDWNLIGSDVNEFIPPQKHPNNNIQSDMEQAIFIYLNGQNIKLYSLSQDYNRMDQTSFKLIGYLVVNNLNFEKNIEIKYTFNNWKSIHYLMAYYNKSITKNIDEFKFTIDLTSLKNILKNQNLIYCNDNTNDNHKITNCPLNMELCCCYDVNNETYYDNNNYKNYNISIMVKTEKKIYSSPEISSSSSKQSITKQPNENENENENENNRSGKPVNSDFLISTTVTHQITKPDNSRRFTDDTDYYNTSPLKHLYHDDTTLIKPTNLNEVIISSIDDTLEDNEESNDHTDIVFNDEEKNCNNNKNNSNGMVQYNNVLPFLLTGDHNDDDDISYYCNYNNNYSSPHNENLMHYNNSLSSSSSSSSALSISQNELNSSSASSYSYDYPSLSSTFLNTPPSLSSSSLSSSITDMTPLNGLTKMNSNNSNNLRISSVIVDDLQSVLSDSTDTNNSNINDDNNTYYISNFGENNDNYNENYMASNNSVETITIGNRKSPPTIINETDYQSLLNSYCFYDPTITDLNNINEQNAHHDSIGIFSFKK